MKKLNKACFLSVLILSLLLSACASSVTAKGALAYTENALLPQAPFDAADAAVLESLLQDLYINEGDICAFRGSGLTDEQFSNISSGLLRAVWLAERTGIPDEVFWDSLKRIVPHILREIDSLNLEDACAALCLERLVLGVDNQARIESWLAAHTHEPSGLLVRSGINFGERGPDEESLYFMMLETGYCVYAFRQCGIDINTEGFIKCVDDYCRNYTFKLPEEENSVLEAGGRAIDFMGLYGMDVSQYASWWEIWRDTFLHQPVDKNTYLNEIGQWLFYSKLFSDDSIQRKLDEYLLNIDFTELLNPEIYDPGSLYELLNHILPELPTEKREAVLARCRYALKRFEELFLSPTIQDSFFAASLAKASGFSVDGDRLLACCCAMLEKEASAADRDLTKLIQNLYYLAMLYEQIRDNVSENARESARILLQRMAESCMKDAVGANLWGDSKRQLCEVLTALGIAKERKFVKDVRSSFDEFLDYEGIKDMGSYFELYMMDRSCGFDKISDEDLQEVLTNLSLDGLYVADARYEPKTVDLRVAYRACCLRTRNEALSLTQAECRRVSEQVAEQFEAAIDSPDLSQLYYYFCLKYMGQQSEGSTP